MQFRAESAGIRSIGLSSGASPLIGAKHERPVLIKRDRHISLLSSCAHARNFVCSVRLSILTTDPLDSQTDKPDC